ncbi:toxin-antitoxin system HicB family antitoxin [Streptomyces luteoverticillatus]|uniref:Toxin-antitoxin system HicB family antitoxin n=1 Tax=Streptomyces luteoverticillatus TaxID=66425 RepID=A0A3S9PH26_STRLT|nr:toxin-antitoxin system HicB family antitoxin [Streptomyces luteoverticillatus]AZQ71615.1 toxin-antitoxin system HicB family antitoxin [Streptomyces luteoverticillatus]
MGVFTVRIPDDLDSDVRKAAADSGLSVNAYMVRTLRRQVVKEAAEAQAAIGGVLLVDTGAADPAEDIR